MSNFKEWVTGWVFLCPLRERKRAWTTLFSATVWTIWEVRNRKVFSDVEPDLSLTKDSIQFRVAWWFKHHGCRSIDPLTTLLRGLGEYCKDPVKIKNCQLEAWKPPRLGSLKFNVDDSAKGQPGLAGIGGVLRNSSGMVSCIFSLFVGTQGAITSELMTINRTISLCVSNLVLQGQVIEIVSDSLVAVTWINYDTFGSFAHVKLVYDIHDLLRVHGFMSVRFCSRSSNFYADNLAKKGSNREGDVMQTKALRKTISQKDQPVSSKTC